MLLFFAGCTDNSCDCYKIIYQNYKVQKNIVIEINPPIEVSREYVGCVDEYNDILKEGFYYEIKCY